MPRASSDVLQHYLAANVRLQRERLGISQEELADRTGVDTRYVRRMESKTGIDVRLSTLRKLAEALECEPGELVRMAVPVEKKAGRPRKVG